MFRKLFYLVSFVLVLTLVGAAQAVTFTWTNDTGNRLWSDGGNWDQAGAVPSNYNDDEVRIDSSPGPIFDTVGVEVKKITFRNTSDLTIDGGTLLVKYDINGADQVGNETTINMNSGTLTVKAHFRVAYKGTGTLNMTGGLIDARDFIIGEQSTTIAHVNLYGGTIINQKNNTFRMGESAGAVGTMDIRTGTLNLDSDNTNVLVEGYINDGLITAYDGWGTLLLVYDATNDETTLKAVHILNPNPMDGSTVSAGSAQLQWTLPEPNLPGGVVTCDVYFGTDPNVEANPKVVIRQAVESVSVTLASNTNYYWTFDLYDSSISTTEPFHLSPVFTFNISNKPPVVNAGDDVARVVQLDGVVSDEDGGPGPATLLWTVITEPNELNPAQIGEPLAANPTVTVIEPGSYTLQLEAGDGEFTTTDTMQIVLFADSCEHAKNQEGFELTPGDINEDCIVNELDLVILIEHWLQENYSTE